MEDGQDNIRKHAPVTKIGPFAETVAQLRQTLQEGDDEIPVGSLVDITCVLQLFASLSLNVFSSPFMWCTDY
jgi:hypothetical protein